MSNQNKVRGFTTYEKLMFVDILIPYSYIIEKSMDIKAKVNVWNQITEDFNKISETGPRNDNELRTFYETLKKQFRRDLAGFKGDVNQLFTHPEIEESRKELNKKMWSVCTEALQSQQSNNSLSNRVLAETQFQQSSDRNNSDNESKSPVLVEVKTEEIPVEEVPELPVLRSIRVVPSLSGFNQKTSGIISSGSNHPPQVRVISRSEFEEKKKMLAAGKLTGLVHSPKVRNNSTESENELPPPSKKPKIEDEEKILRLDILKIQKHKAEIERDILLVELEKKKIELELEKKKLT